LIKLFQKYKKWRENKWDGSHDHHVEWCEDYGVHSKSMEEVWDIRQQICEIMESQKMDRLSSARDFGTLGDK
jgi:hypothetical protein